MREGSEQTGIGATSRTQSAFIASAGPFHMARVSSSTRRRPTSRSLAEYHSAWVCAPPPRRRRRWTEPERRAREEYWRRSSPDADRCAGPDDGRRRAGLEQWGIRRQLRGGTVADLGNREGERPVAACRGAISAALACVMPTASSTARCKATSRRSSCSDQWSGNRRRPGRFPESS